MNVTRLINTVILTASLVSALTHGGMAQPYQFTNFTNKDQITDLAYVSGNLWASTTGGLIEYNQATGAVQGFINTDGLRSNEIDFVAPTSQGDIYFGSADGVLIHRDNGGFNTWQLQAREGTRISLNAADTSGDFLWIASSVGLIKFDRFRFGGEVRETYRTLGAFQSESEVFDVAILGDKVYAATSAGLAFAEHENQFLLDPNEWTNNPFFANGLDVSSISELEVFANQLFIGTNAGLYSRLADGTFELQQIPGAYEILDLYSTASELYIVGRSGNTRGVWELSAGLQSLGEISATVINQIQQVAHDGSLYLGTAQLGVYRVDGGAGDQIEVDGPASNDLVGGGLTSTGDLYAVSRFNALSVRRNGVWGKIALTSREKLHGIVSQDDDLWVGTFGDGVFRVHSDNSFEKFSYNNSPLLGIAQDPTISIVNNLYEDPHGRIWFSLFQASPFRPMVMFDPSDSAWAYWDAGVGLLSGNNQVIAAGLNTAVVGIDDQGVGFLRYGSDPFNPNDDELSYFARQRRLPTNAVTALAYDRDDLLWVGTGQGLVYFDSDIEFFFPQELPAGVSAVVTALVSDSRNNLWVGTNSGLALVPAAGGLPQSFTSQNSDLIDDQIEALSYDENSNQLAIFTSGGLSLVDLNVGSDVESTGIYAYPNPFRIRLGEENRLAFNLDQRGDVRIFTVAGDLVNRTTVNAGWDGRNESGELVASGIYLFHIKAEDESHHTGKIFVIRR